MVEAVSSRSRVELPITMPSATPVTEAISRPNTQPCKVSGSATQKSDWPN